ncbi:MAG: dTDP-4-amino-4,6-dideoxygalactose transaminase [Bacteroidales bacterium]|nr:dTDP-4-amino-4,6-dideoxygalactose transaminase [Bacteroidales bacterium]
MNIPFNIPYFCGKEANNLLLAAQSGKISGNGIFTKKCHTFFESKYGFKKVLLTNSCTTALEMAALLINISQGDEIIMPSFTFVSTATAFAIFGAKIIFADSDIKNPNINISEIENLITNKTKAIVVVHYAGVACDMDKIMEIANKHNIFVIEDAAHAIDSYYKGKPLGSIGHFGAFSFHETKNIISGEGGMLAINDEKFVDRAEIIWDKGTNRAAFSRGEVSKYEWIDIGSSYLPSEMTAAFLFSQLDSLDLIQRLRKKIWNQYFNNLKPLEEKKLIKLAYFPDFATNNANMFYILLKDYKQRNTLLDYLKKNNIQAVFHYLPLHSSKYYKANNEVRILKNCDYYSNCILRLPFYNTLKKEQINFVCDKIKSFFE